MFISCRNIELVPYFFLKKNTFKSIYSIYKAFICTDKNKLILSKTYLQVLKEYKAL